MPDENLSIDDAAIIARAVVDKTTRETPADFIQFGTITSVNNAIGGVPYADVHMDGDPIGHTVTVASLIGIVLYAGLRVAVLFDRPHGAYIVGSPSVTGVPMARAGLTYGGST